MTSLHQIRVTWTGLSGLPGVSTFYSSGDKDVTIAAIRTFFEGIATSLPSAVRINYPTSGVDVDISTGAVTGAWTSLSRAATAGTNTGLFAAPAGAVVNWRTGFYLGGRELRGKTFLVPLSGSAYQSDGTLVDTVRQGIQDAATTLIGSTVPPRIWSRKQGADATVTAASVPDKVVILRSRRD
jgi:hypothetical protein